MARMFAWYSAAGRPAASFMPKARITRSGWASITLPMLASPHAVSVPPTARFCSVTLAPYAAFEIQDQQILVGRLEGGRLRPAGGIAAGGNAVAQQGDRQRLLVP